jgi:phospholipid transport system transporter-binding protein
VSVEQPAVVTVEQLGEVTVAQSGDVFALQGALSFETVPAVLADSDQYAARTDLPDRLTIDFAQVSHVDSAAVALLLEWLRRAKARGKTLAFVNLPANLLALARLYGVAELIQPAASA